MNKSKIIVIIIICLLIGIGIGLPLGYFAFDLTHQVTGNKNLLSKEEAAAYLKITVEQLNNLVAAKPINEAYPVNWFIEEIKIDNDTVYFNKNQLDGWIHARSGGEYKSPNK